ncbi:MAG: ABC transporter permease, partial [Escherichia coli]|nr:ABC transporter permease [Escherichia coli]
MRQSTQKAVREPRFYIAKRDDIPFWKSWLVRIIAVIVALIVSAVITLLVTGENPISVYATMIDGAFGTERRTWNLFQRLAMLLCVGLAVTPAFKMRFWNIGAEGQVLAGGLASAACMILLGDTLSTPLLLLAIVVTSMLAGAIWAVIPAIFKANFGTNETLFTLMMNYIAIQLVSYFTYIWSVPKGSGQIGIINSDTQAGWLPEIGGQRYLLNIIIVAVLA